MKKILIIIVGYCLTVCCSPKTGLEIEIINDTIHSVRKTSDRATKFLSDSVYREKGKNILKYKITNTDSKTYYFNLLMDSKFVKETTSGIAIDKGFLNFLDKEGIAVKTHGFSPSTFSECKDSFWKVQETEAKELEYEMSGIEKYYYDTANFVIHPNETLYFESVVYLPMDGVHQFHNARFNDKQEYSAEIIMFSDSTNYKKNVSRTVLQTIKDNHYEVYHGKIKSKNKVPVKFID